MPPQSKKPSAAELLARLSGRQKMEPTKEDAIQDIESARLAHEALKKKTDPPPTQTELNNAAGLLMTFEDTYNTLKYADRAKHIKAVLKSNVVSVDAHVTKYKKIVDNLQVEINELKVKLSSYEDGTMVPVFKTPGPDPAHLEFIERLKTQLNSIFMQKINVRKELIEYECTERDLTFKIKQRKMSLKRLKLISIDQCQRDKVRMNMYTIGRKNRFRLREK